MDPSTILIEWRRCKKRMHKAPNDELYVFAYWLIRHSGYKVSPPDPCPDCGRRLCPIKDICGRETK